MPTPSTYQQKAMVAQFVNITGSSDRMAMRFLKASGFKVNDAVELFYATSSESKNSSPIEPELENMFNSLRDDKVDEKDKLDLDSTMEYFSKVLYLNLENAEIFVIIELVKAPSVGEITRKGFVEGWKKTGVSASKVEQRKHMQKLISSLSTDMALFREVYRYAFVAGREKDQKALSLENALIYWGMLFTAPGVPWRSKTRDWLELWQKFLNEKWTRSVNKDMWNMTLEFALKSMVDETMSFWREDGAWPSVIDDFVAWCRAKGIGRVESMEVDG